MSVLARSRITGVVQSLSDSGVDEGTISRADYDSFLTMGGGGSANLKSAVVAGASFAGSPKKYSVVFTTAYPDDQYSILITGADSRSFTFESKTANGFVINTNAGTAIAGDVVWFTSPLGE